MRSIHLKAGFISSSFDVYKNDLVENRESTLETHLKYVEEEIEIRIESIKINFEGFG